MGMPSILALVTDAFGGEGGIARYNRDLLEALASAGYSVRALPRAARKGFALPGGIQQDPPRRGRIAFAVAALLAGIRYRPELVFCGHLFLAPLAFLIARLTRAKLIIQMHGIEAWSQPSQLQRAAVETADIALCVSRYTRSCVIGWSCLPPERVIVLPNTVGEAFVPGDGSALRACLGLIDKPVLLTVGRMDGSERYKGQARVIEALPQLIAKGHDAAYVIVGGGDDRPRLEEIASRAGMRERVHFLGEVSEESLVEAYRSADLFVMPSTGEGFGIVFLEAMASGTPAIGLGVAGAQDALAEGELGTLVQEEELATAIARLLSAPRPNAKALSAAVHCRFGRERFRHQVGAVFDRVRATA